LSALFLSFLLFSFFQQLVSLRASSLSHCDTLELRKYKFMLRCSFKCKQKFNYELLENSSLNIYVEDSLSLSEKKDALDACGFILWQTSHINDNINISNITMLHVVKAYGVNHKNHIVHGVKFIMWASPFIHSREYFIVYESEAKIT
jgi:hypothetical protein